MTTDLLEAKQRGPEKAALEQVEEYQQEVFKERFVFKTCLTKVSSQESLPFFSYFSHKHSEGVQFLTQGLFRAPLPGGSGTQRRRPW